MAMRPRTASPRPAPKVRRDETWQDAICPDGSAAGECGQGDIHMTGDGKGANRRVEQALSGVLRLRYQ